MMDQVTASRLAVIRAAWKLTATLRSLVNPDGFDDRLDRHVVLAFNETASFRDVANRHFDIRDGLTPLTETEASDRLGPHLVTMLKGRSEHVSNKAVDLISRGDVTIVESTATTLVASVKASSKRGWYRAGSTPDGPFCDCQAGEAGTYCSHVLAAHLLEAAMRLNIIDKDEETRR